MYRFLHVVIAAATLAGCSVSGSPDDRSAAQGSRTANSAAADEARGTRIRIDRDGTRVEGDAGDIRIGRDGIEIEIDRDVEVNVGDVRAQVRAGEDGSVTLSTNRQ